MTTSSSKREHNLELAAALLDWNRRHLRQGAPLDVALIGERFAPQFVVEANGRRYEADRPAYLAFLEGFRRDIAQIDYRVHHRVADDNGVVLAMGAEVTRLDGRLDRFEAMLLLRFDAQGLLTLWHEVYLPAPAAAAA
ncbi:nuclear transport factor 2 family protein [Roseateles sp. DAIF2]|uniref:nuclear transport factor 2 family protein n=1 Tax=Roseateles sp. DAIF2 TaxID=2714952 RepID=UPI0018A2E16F|nr:nuclear transport factor 2 family protein [Roseateles sp. DAIF2]QPF71628.1 nuclear transport factor 2 family protein [Roseateles sp. DAIF2]